MWRPRDPDWDSRVRQSFARQGFMTLIAGEIVALEPGRCAVAIRARDDLCQQRGLLHGGVTAALADTACGYAAYSLMPAGTTPLTVEFKINLMAPALGERFVATANVLRSGRVLTIVEADVVAERCGASAAIARMLATILCRDGSDSGRPPQGERTS